MATKIGTSTQILATGTVLLLVAAVLVRGLASEPGPEPMDAVPDEEEARLAAPMQFLEGGAELRLRDLDAWIGEGRLIQWAAHHDIPFHLAGCPSLHDWFESEPGQRVDRLLSALRQGQREEAIAALALVFQIARATDWDPGIRGRSQHAERLGALLEDWLRVWAERSADDPVLYEPALAVAIFYGRVLRIAYRAPTFGRNEAAYERAHRFLMKLTGAGKSKLTAFGEVLAARHGRAFAMITVEDDFLLGFEEEARVLFPGLDGDCED